MGFVASKKVGGSVVRNRSKRLLREAFRSLRANVKLEDMDIVLIARSPCGDAGIHEVVEDLRDAYKRAGLWINDTACAGDPERT